MPVFTETCYAWMSGGSQFRIVNSAFDGVVLSASFLLYVQICFGVYSFWAHTPVEAYDLFAEVYNNYRLRIP